MTNERKIAVIGLGYVGLPLALAFADKFAQVIGFDISDEKIKKIKDKIDPTDEGLSDKLSKTSLQVTSNSQDLKNCDFFVVGVPTPIDEYKNPDLRPLQGACKTVASVLKRGDIVVFESTVYPGLTEEYCANQLELSSGLKCGVDFFLGYSPERINPGDKERTLEKIVKVVSAQNNEILNIVSETYKKIISAGVYQASSIKVAEAAKVIENTQRDLNIALMNELAIIFNKMGIRTKDVIDTAATKWNFLKFTPGLVGGHCIGVDPYYLTTKAQTLGIHPQVVLAGRRINDDMGIYVAQQIIKKIINIGLNPKGLKVGVLGITFKENVSDVRNSRVPDIIHELNSFGCNCLTYDPRVSQDEVQHEYGIKLSKFNELSDLDCVILAVPHKEILQMGLDGVLRTLKVSGLLVDIKSVYSPNDLDDNYSYWSL
jgi:UDP-N-acetyl-D-galactosamine dehydrogenase